ncbi:HupE/UreJ family protein [Deinococcus pimensis]|uniref:HupE/UreJ family protein n=1 Tax=Deinococcus pimensis TaxID=309888 RepID=UPI000693273D|nr:HupE/UreJ family protein [Deinococcus pimensis]
MKPVWRRLVTLVALLLTFASSALAHSITFSHVNVRLNGTGTKVTVQLPVAALLHESPSPLPKGTTEVALKETPLRADVRASLTQLVTARLRLSSGTTVLPVTVTSVEPAGQDVTLTATAPTVTGALNVSANLFPEDTLHKVFVEVYRSDALVGQYALDTQNAALTLAAPAQPLGQVVLTFVREGIHHIFIGPDHILFVLALILLGGRVGTQLKVITAFTVAHSVTLVLATLGIVELPSRLVESVIALSIVVVGLHDFLQLRRGQTTGRDPRAVFAFAFGLVHGFGFASVLSELSLPREALGWSLAAFNVGVEVGQVVIVLLAAPVLLLLRRVAPPRVSQGVLVAAAGVVVLTGGVWFVQRALGL